MSRRNKKWKKRKNRKVVRKSGLNRHHVLPSSRGGGFTDNIVLLPASWHAMWHQLFSNMTVDEVHDYIDAVMQPNRKWTHSDLLLMLETIRQWREDDDCTLV